MKEELATDIREFIQEYFDAWQEGAESLNDGASREVDR
jgi:hypothetical protein